MTKRERILNEVEYLVSQFLYYGRKEDDDLPVGSIEAAVHNGEISETEIVTRFTDSLRKGL